MSKKNIRGLYAITHHDRLTLKKLISDVELVLQGGASIIQFRDKNSQKTEKLIRAEALQKLCKDYQSVFLINDDIQLCKKINADGVHLGINDASITTARQMLGDEKIIGATCHNSIELALQAQALGADYIALGKFFPSITKNEAPLADISCIDHIKSQCSLPIVAIGGITLDNAPSLLACHVNAIAVINALFSEADIKQRAQQFSNLFID